MKFLLKLMAVAFAALLAGCGGGLNEQPHEVMPRADAAVRLNTLPGFTVVSQFSENIVNYLITKTSVGYNVTDRGSAAVSTAIAGVALLQFADTSVILGGSDGNAGKAYRLYQAAFARTPDLSGLSFWIDHLNMGMSLAEVSSHFQNSAEFKSLYGTGISNTALVTLLYQNVLRRLPDSGGLAFWVDALSQGKLTQQAVLMYFSESAENKSLVAPAIQNGIAYLPSTVDAPNNLAVTNVSPQTVASNIIASSTKLQVTWKKAAGYTANHFLVTASETIGRSTPSFSVPSTETTVTLTGLKSATRYSVVVSACLDAACARSEPSAAAEGLTSSEYWQLQGTGNTTAGLSRIVSDGNARISATLFGPEAGGATANRIQLYYGPSLVSGRQTLSTALTASATSTALASSYLSFVSSGATTGLLTPTPAATLIETIATGQGVPLSAAMGGKVRLFFEAQGIDRKTRIFTIDSVDGYGGQDFNTGSSTVCSTTADYSSGGGCAITVAIGLEGDSVTPNSKIINARQNKVGYPTLTDWRWDGAPGTFMVFTSGNILGCSTASRTHGYAVWDGGKWNVQYDTAGCPKLFVNVQAAFPMHLGGVKYKLYYGDPSITTGKSSSSLPFLGPKKVIYADGTHSGLNDRVDFEDWESQSNARGVIFLWPNGTELDSTAEGYIDDFHFLSPTGSLDLQVMYLAITNGSEVPLGASAVLINP